MYLKTPGKLLENDMSWSMGTMSLFFGSCTLLSKLLQATYIPQTQKCHRRLLETFCKRCWGWCEQPWYSGLTLSLCRKGSGIEVANSQIKFKKLGISCLQVGIYMTEMILKWYKSPKQPNQNVEVHTQCINVVEIESPRNNILSQRGSKYFNCI